MMVSDDKPTQLGSVCGSGQGNQAPPLSADLPQALWKRQGSCFLYTHHSGISPEEGLQGSSGSAGLGASLVGEAAALD